MDAGRASLVGMQEPAQSTAAMQDAMQLMFGPDGTPMHLPAPSTSQQDQQQQELEGPPPNKPALMQRLSVLARRPADSPSLRPFNMLAAPPAAPTPFLQPSPAYLSQSPDETSSLTPAQYRPPGEVLPPGVAPASSLHADVGDMAHPSQPRLSMTGVVRDASVTQEPWLSSEPPPNPLVAKKANRHSTAAGARQKKKSKAGQLHAVSEAASAVEVQGDEQDVQPEFSFSPLGDSSGRIQEIAFSPLAAGAGQVQSRPSMAQRIRKSLFGPTAREASPPVHLNHVKVLFWDLFSLPNCTAYIMVPEVIGWAFACCEYLFLPRTRHKIGWVVSASDILMNSMCGQW